MPEKPKVLFLLPPSWAALGKGMFSHPAFTTLFQDEDAYAPDDIAYFAGFSPPPGFLKTLPNLKAVFSLGAGVDGFMADTQYPRQVPLMRFVNSRLQQEMAQYVVLQVLGIHRHQRFYDAAQTASAWRQLPLRRATHEVGVGILGLGDIGTTAARQLAAFNFRLSGWSRSRKAVEHVTSFAGVQELPAFLAQCDILVCILPLTPETSGILDATLFAQLPQGAWVINVARGGHCVEEDLVAALDCGHLAGAVLDVFRTEPLPQTSPLWTHPKIRVTPHVAGITNPAAAIGYIADGIALAQSGLALGDSVDFSRGY